MQGKSFAEQFAIEANLALLYGIALLIKAKRSFKVFSVFKVFPQRKIEMNMING